MSEPLQTTCSVGKFFGGQWLGKCGSLDGHKYVCLDKLYEDIINGNCLVKIKLRLTFIPYITYRKNWSLKEKNHYASSITVLLMFLVLMKLIKNLLKILHFTNENSNTQHKPGEFYLSVVLKE
jgi:hypothetical protein